MATNSRFFKSPTRNCTFRVKEGIVDKRGGKTFPLFQRRKLILWSTASISYYKLDSRDSLVESSIKSLSLSGLSRRDIQRSDKTAKSKQKSMTNYGFKIMTKKRTYYFSVGGSTLRDEWISCIRNAVDGVITRPYGPRPLPQSVSKESDPREHEDEPVVVTITRKNTQRNYAEKTPIIIRRTPSNSFTSNMKSSSSSEWVGDLRDWSDSTMNSDSYSVGGNDVNDDASDTPPVVYKKQPVFPSIVPVDDTIPPLPSSIEHKSNAPSMDDGMEVFAPTETRKTTQIGGKWKRNNLQIFLNGSPIRDIVSHVIDRMIAEDEWYEQEDDDLLDEEDFDPNRLHVYDDDY